MVPLVIVPILLAAAPPIPLGSPVPFQAPARAVAASADMESAPVENFDPLARSAALAQELPRSWSGTYQSFGSAAALPAQLQLTSLVPMGQMLVLQGSLSIGGVTAPVQGNLNAKSDQLDLLVLGGQRFDGLESGGEFQGLQGLELIGWNAPRLTSAGGRLQLQAGRPAGGRLGAPTVRGLW